MPRFRTRYASWQMHIASNRYGFATDRSIDELRLLRRGFESPLAALNDSLLNTPHTAVNLSIICTVGDVMRSVTGSSMGRASRDAGIGYFICYYIVPPLRRRDGVFLLWCPRPINRNSQSAQLRRWLSLRTARREHVLI